MFTPACMSRIFTFAILLLASDHLVQIKSESFFYNASLARIFSPAIATAYGDPYGSGSGGACGFTNDVAQAPYYGMISAGNNNLFKSGKGCGTCYRIKCTDNPSCSGRPITVTITDECPYACNNEAFHFDLSGKAFGALAKPGLADELRKAGRIIISYRRIRCRYNTGLTLKIDQGSNSYYLGFAVEDLNGDGDVGYAEIRSLNSNRWMPMQQSWGATWIASLPEGTKGPYSVRLTTIESRRRAVAYNIIPADWAPGRSYRSRVNT